MASYYVLTPPGSTNPEKDTLFIRDGFSWIAFLVPLPWLLARKLWLIAGLAVAFYVLAILLAEYLGLDAMPVAFSVILSLWTGLEGGHVRGFWLRRKGWDIKSIIVADSLEEAEALYFSGDGVDETVTSEPIRGRSDMLARPSNTLALGLIGPYGNR